MTALDLSCEAGHTPVVELLLAHKAALNLNRSKHNALHYACSSGHKDIVDVLLTQKNVLHKSKGIK
jgi:ankyrin repeat protein